MNFVMAAFSLTVFFLGFAFIRTRLRASRLSKLSWDELIAKLAPVASKEIMEIALIYLHPSKNDRQFNSQELWSMIGESTGLENMYANAQILIALAGYAQRWNPEESALVCERMRRDGMTLRRATLGISVGASLGSESISPPSTIQEAASAYYLMTQRLLVLYEKSHAGRVPRIADAL